MDFAGVLDRVDAFLTGRGWRFALAGGVALGGPWKPSIDERDLPVTPEDVVALRRLRAEVPSWLLLTWRERQALIPLEGVRARPAANDRWLRFSLD